MKRCWPAPSGSWRIFRSFGSPPTIRQQWAQGASTVCGVDEAGAGPLAGLEAVLSAAVCDALVCVPCDLPNLTADVPRLLAERFSPELDALVLADSGGRLHPLCGVYHRRALPAIRRQLEQGEWRVLDLLPHLRWARLSGVVPDRVLYNLNTPEDLLRLSNAADP